MSGREEKERTPGRVKRAIVLAGAALLALFVPGRPSAEPAPAPNDDAN